MAAGTDSWSEWANRTPSLTRFLTAKGDRWKSRACCYDGAEYSSWVESQPVTIINTAPHPPTALAVTPVSPRPNDDLVAVASGGTDPDGNSPTYV